MMNLTETTLNSKEIFDGKVLHMFHDEVALPDGGHALREIVRHPGGVCIAALDKDDNLCFVRQFRYPYKEVVLELPGYTDEIIHLYACRIQAVGDSCPDEDEFLTVERIPLNKAVEMVLNNQLPDAKTQIAVLKTKLLLDSGKI